MGRRRNRAHHADGETHQQHLQQLVGELAEVMANAVREFADVRHDGLLRKPRQPATFVAMIWSMLAGRTGISWTTYSMNFSRLLIVRAGFQRFSKPSVEEGLPESPAPQALPA